MKPRFLFVLLMVSGLNYSQAQSPKSENRIHCNQGSTAPGKPEEIFYTVVDKICFKDKAGISSCSKSIVTDKDHCKNPQTLLKQYCDDQGLPAEKEILCQCENGLCKK